MHSICKQMLQKRNLSVTFIYIEETFEIFKPSELLNNCGLERHQTSQASPPNAASSAHKPLFFGLLFFALLL